MHKVLFLTYYFPPMGGGGVQRTTKFVKYLPDYEFSPTVVAGTGLFGDGQKVLVDASLCEEVKHANIYRIELNVSEYLTYKISDNKVAKKIPALAFKWWVSAATRTCIKAIQHEKPDVIYVTVSPFQAVEVATRIASKYNIPWVLDMRDPWALDPIMVYPTWFHYKLDLRAMKKACMAADAVILNTPRSLKRLKDKFPGLDADKLFWITNGWDSDEIEKNLNPNTTEASQKLIIVHTGTFHTKLAIKIDPSSRRELGLGGKKPMDYIRYCPGRSHLLARTPYYLLKAIKLLIDEGKISKDDISLIFAGLNTPSDKNLVERFGLQDMVEFKGYLNHAESIQLISFADVLFLPLHVPHNGQYPLIVPGKVYEYMAAQKPILALVPKGDAMDFVRRSNYGYICQPTNVQQISRVVLSLLHRHRSVQERNTDSTEDFLSQFERKSLTREIAAVLNFAMEAR